MRAGTNFTVPRWFQRETGYEASFFRFDRKIREDVRPHPGPLPRGEGESIAALLEDRTTGFTRWSSIKAEVGYSCSFSPREKVRLRASVKHKLDGFNDRPHPGPLPRERENRSPRFEPCPYARGSCVSRPMTQNGSRRRRSLKISCDAPRHTLSPGKRAGVRASVNSNSTENIEELILSFALRHYLVIGT